MKQECKCECCGARMEVLEGAWVLIAEKDVPGFGSRTEVMVTPRETLRVKARKCPDPQCGHLEFFQAP